MKNLKRKILGFTMIELLIVVTVLGILAVAVLSAINPIEQINRGKDTGSRSDAEQLLSAIDRFYTQGYYPWQTGATDIDDVTTPWGDVNLTAWADDNNVAVLTKLSSGGTAEIKESFVTRITASTYNTLKKYNRGQQGDSTYICFLPKSANFETEAGIRCGATLPADFPSSGACPAGCAVAKTCYSCLP